jgi:hypothetical protein
MTAPPGRAWVNLGEYFPAVFVAGFVCVVIGSYAGNYYIENMLDSGITVLHLWIIYDRAIAVHGVKIPEQLRGIEGHYMLGPKKDPPSDCKMPARIN